MEKIKLLGISKKEQRSSYTFPKEQKLFEIIRKVLVELGFENDDYGINGFGRPWDQESEKPDTDKEEDIKSKEYNEGIINFRNKDYSVDIIFFKSKVVLIFNYKKDKQQEISKIFGGFILEEE